jgi:hypothetical protein
MNFLIVFFGYNLIIAKGLHILFFANILFLVFIAFISLRSWRKKWEFRDIVEIGIENVIKEADFLPTFLKYSIPLLIMLILVYFLGGDHISKFYSVMYVDSREFSLFQNIIRILIMPFYIITYVAIFKNLLFNRHRFFLAKGCAILCSEKGDTVDKMKYLTMCLSFYNKYLRHRLSFHINNLEKIASKIAASIPPQKKIFQNGNNPYNANNTSLESISLDLAREFDEEDDKLAPLRYLTKFLEKEEKVENLLGEETLSQKIQRNPIIIPSIPATVTILVTIINVSIGK